MQVYVGRNYFSIDGDRAGHEANDSQRYKTLLTQWAEAIRSLVQDGEAAGIPIDSEYVEFGKFVLCLVAIRQQQQVIVRGAWCHDDWFEWESAYILGARCDRGRLIQGSFSTPGFFGTYDIQQLVGGLLNAKLI